MSKQPTEPRPMIYNGYELRPNGDRWQVYKGGQAVSSCLYKLTDAKRAVDEIVMRQKL